METPIYHLLDLENQAFLKQQQHQVGFTLQVMD